MRLTTASLQAGSTLTSPRPPRRLLSPVDALFKILDNSPGLHTLDLTSCRGVPLRQRKAVFEVRRDLPAAAPASAPDCSRLTALTDARLGPDDLPQAYDEETARRTGLGKRR